MNEPEQRTKLLVSADPLDVADLAASVSAPDSGASVIFTGTARDHSPGKSDVSHLEYEAYPEQVEAKITEIIDEARGRWSVLHVTVAHRVGHVQVGQPSVVVAVSSAHRVEAFEAARYLIDELKTRAPIWKKEHWSGGAEWVEGA
ncbi:MAG: molybdenum cofactor biosynthesis protein MoaE [Acidimicrobiia bacterium]|nr:molybdenum cofactor biosynthesis protein MoaE [Acidimicrobiia bacterium]